MNTKSNNCAINERTGDGTLVGRCWFALKDMHCPRHGDVSKVQEHFDKTGKLTDEFVHDPKFKRTVEARK